MVDLYLGGSFEYRHEVEQFNEILSILMENRNRLGDFCVVFGCAYISGDEIDCIIFNDKAIIAIEMKDWKGVIYGTENGNWRIGDQEMKTNIFRQCSRKRYALIDELKECFQNRRHDVRVWAVFSRGTDCSSIDISDKNKRWFRSLSLDGLLSELIIERSPNVIRNKRALNPLISKLTLQKKDPSHWLEEDPSAQFEDLKHLFPAHKGKYKEYSFKKSFGYDYVVQYPYDPSETESIVICFVRNKVTGKEHLNTMAVRIPFGTWEKIEDYILKVEHSWGGTPEIEDIKIPGRENIVRVGPLRSYGHDGYSIEVLKEGRSLPSPKRIWLNIRAVKKLQEIIEERRNE